MFHTGREICGVRHTFKKGKESQLVVDAKVIVMEPSDSQARALEALLRFLDLDPVRFHDMAELGRKTEGAHDWLALIIGVQSDLLFPIDEQAAIATALRENGTAVQFAPLASLEGHDAFLVDFARFDPALRDFLSRG